MRRDDQKCDVLKIVKRMVKTNPEIIGENCIRNGNGVLAVGNEFKISSKSYHEKLVNPEVAWDRNSKQRTSYLFDHM